MNTLSSHHQNPQPRTDPSQLGRARRRTWSCLGWGSRRGGGSQSGRGRRRGCLEQWQEECRAEEQLPDLVVEDEAQGLRVEERQPDLGGGGAAARSGGRLGLGETEGVGENPGKMNPFQPNPFASKPIPSRPICHVNLLTLIQTIPRNNTTQKLQILSNLLAGLHSGGAVLAVRSRSAGPQWPPPPTSPLAGPPPKRATGSPCCSR